MTDQETVEIERACIEDVVGEVMYAVPGCVRTDHVQGDACWTVLRRDGRRVAIHPNGYWIHDEDFLLRPSGDSYIEGLYRPTKVMVLTTSVHPIEAIHQAIVALGGQLS